MFKRELKVNLKSFILWTAILVILYLIVFSIYPSLFTDENTEMIDQMMKMLPEEVLKAFNMDITSISSAFGWFKTEGFIFVLLIIGVYSGVLGSSILLKEENNKTIEYLHSLPVTRKKIIFNKIASGLIYILMMIVLVGTFNYIGLELVGDLDKKQYFLLCITPVFSSVVIFFLCLFISTFTHKTKNTIGLSLGIVFISYFLNMVSEMGESTESLKYASIFTLADVRNVILNVEINPIIILLTLVFSAVLMILTLIRYEKKELV